MQGFKNVRDSFASWLSFLRLLRELPAGRWRICCGQLPHFLQRIIENLDTRLRGS